MRYYGQPLVYFVDECTEEQVYMLMDYMLEDLTGEPAGPMKDMPDLRGFHEHLGDGRLVTR